MNTMVERLDSLDERIARLEAGGDLVDETVVDATLATPPAANITATELRHLQDGVRFVVQEGTTIARLDLTGRSDVHVAVHGRVDEIWMADARRIEISGRGSVGKISVSEWAQGRAGHRNFDIAIKDVEIVGTESAMDLQYITNVLIKGVTTSGINKYAIWMSNCTNAYVHDCNLSTAGRESCVRLVNVQFGEVARSELRSDYKHCFRIHGVSNNIVMHGCTLEGPRAVMVASMPDDRVSNVEIRDNAINDAQVHLLGLPADTTQLRFFKWLRNRVTNSQVLMVNEDETWTIE